MEFSGVDTMSFDLKQMITLDVKARISGTDIRAAATVFSDNKIQNAIWFMQGNFTLCMTLDSEDAENLIDTLTKHIANIKENELELLALQTKEAA